MPGLYPSLSPQECASSPAMSAALMAVCLELGCCSAALGAVLDLLELHRSAFLALADCIGELVVRDVQLLESEFGFDRDGLAHVVILLGCDWLTGWSGC